jgi:hypothetical protein
MKSPGDVMGARRRAWAAGGKLDETGTKWMADFATRDYTS